MKVLKASAIATLVLVALQGCSSHRFVATGDAPKVDSKGANCGATVLISVPSTPYQELGICYAQVPGGGMISDNTPEAIEELQKCACEAGGDAVLLGGTNDQSTMTMYGSTQQNVKTQGIVIIRGK
jgi:hypothetical protein